MTRWWGATGLYLLCSCSLITGAESAPCPSGVTQVSVTTVGHVADLVSLMDCTGGGAFDVVWTGRVAIDETIEVAGSNQLTITASSSSSPSAVGAGLGAEHNYHDGVVALNPDVRLFLVSGESATLSLNGLMLEGGTALSGGAIAALSSSPGGAAVNVVDCEFKHNNAATFGGAIYSMNSEINLVGSRFSNNSASDGGAIYSVGGGSLNVSGGSHFFGNAAFSGGGAVSVSAPSVTTSLAIGAEASITFDGVEFVANVAGSGGAFMLSAAGPIEGRFDGCTFLENAAAGKGGAMYLLNGAGALDVRDTLFESNRAEESGGALFLAAGVLGLENTAFALNQARAGGFAVTSRGSVDFSDAFFVSNTLLCPSGQYSREQDAAEAEVKSEDTCRLEMVCSGCSSGGACGGGDVPEGLRLLDGGTVPVCEDLPEGARATSSGATVTGLSLEAGYYRASNESAVVLECYREEACAGGSDASQYCAPGYQGHYCADCAEGYAPGVGYSCRECLGAGERWGVGLSVGVAVVAVLSVVVFDLMRVVDSTAREDKTCVEEQTNGFERVSGSWTCFFRETFPCQAVKIAIVAWQIVRQFAEISGSVFPDEYQDFLYYLGPVNLDVGCVLSLSCTIRTSFYDRLLVTTLSPLFLLGALVFIHSVARTRNEGSRAGAAAAAAALETVDNKHLSAGLFVAFFSYSPAVFILLQTFSCDYGVGAGGEGGGGGDGGAAGYLRADYGLECSTVTHGAYKVYAAFMLSVYAVGVPAAFVWFLGCNRRDLKASGGSGRRDRMGHLRGWGGIWRAYRPSRYYYEVVECGRRLALAGVSVLGAPNSPLQIAAALAVAASFFFVSECLSPFQRQADAGMYRWGNVVVLASIYSALLSRAGLLPDAAGSSSSLAGWLIAGNVAMILALAALFVARVAAWYRRRKNLADFRPTRIQPESFAL